MAAREKAREYERTHPWITFRFDTRPLDHQTWLLLGEAKSKCEHIKGAPLLPNTVRQMYRVYLAKGALATTAIEGNTLTEEEVERRIKGELKLPPSKEYLGKEIDNVVAAYNDILKRTLTDGEADKLSVEVLTDFNKMVLEELPLEEGVTPGEIRNYPVHVGRYHAAPGEDCEYLTNQYVKWLNEMEMPEEERFVFGILKAIMAHLYFVWIHPFGNGNGRIARLIEFQILLSFGAPAVAAHLLSNHYNLTRTEYYRHLDRASRSQDGYVEFIRYALQGFVDGLREEIESIQEQQVMVHWINHIHDTFKGRHLKTEERQKDLMLEISNRYAGGG
jgi:Fic family protein